jgi:hypothetical protein
MTTISLIGIVGGGVQSGPLCTAANSRPIVPAPLDYDDAEFHHKPHMLSGREPGPLRWEASD